MVFVLFIIVVSLLVIAFAEPLGERLGVVAPIILLAVSVATGFLPQVPPVDIDPEIILQLILPPLLFATAMRMPAHDFRRNFGAILGLAVVLVVVTAVVVGVVIHLLVPQIPLAIAIAVGAVVSPSDAVAVGIVKRAGVSRRIVAILDGEGLINDASALVVLSTALIAAGSKVSAPEVAGRFVWAVVGAAAVGYVVGKLSMFLRRYVHHPTSNTVLSLAIPFAAFLPAEEIGASGLVATVVAGLMVSRAAPRDLPPATRMSDNQTWDTVGLILESLVFVIMGLQMPALIHAADSSEFPLITCLVVSLVVWLVVLVVRAAVVMPMLWRIRQSTEKMAEREAWLAEVGERLDIIAEDPRVREGTRAQKRVDHGRKRIDRGQADTAYFAGKPLGLRAGGVIIWAGMRGAVTLAAAQTLPHDTPERSFLIFVAFAVALLSLVVQGGTLQWVVEKLQPGSDAPSSMEEKLRLRNILGDAAESVEVPAELRGILEASGLSHFQMARFSALDLARVVRGAEVWDDAVLRQLAAYSVQRVVAKRDALITDRDAGRIDAADFDNQLRLLDGEQLAIEAQVREFLSHQDS